MYTPLRGKVPGVGLLLPGERDATTLLAAVEGVSGTPPCNSLTQRTTEGRLYTESILEILNGCRPFDSCSVAPEDLSRRQSRVRSIPT